MKTDSLISQIKNDKMNLICFDCGAENPTFVSINNGIFLCGECATVHMSFPQGISIIENNDLDSLSENELKYLSLGGNTRLNDFILDEFPKLENYSQKLLYKTRGMDYYRKRLNYFVNGGAEPRRPSQIVGCQLVPDNYYQNNSNKKVTQKFEPKTRTFRPEQQIKSRKFNINQKNNENDDDEEEFFKDPFMNEGKFGLNEGKMFKKFFGNDFFGDDEFYGFGKNNNKMSQTQKYNKPPPSYQEKPKVEYKRNIEPKDNVSKKQNPPVFQHRVQQRPLTASNPIFVPSRKHKYIKKEEQNNNNNNDNNNNNYNNYNRNNYTYNTNNNNYNRNNNNNNNNNRIIHERPENNRGEKYNPFKRRDSTELITLPGSENKTLLNNKRKEKTNEIPQEFRTNAKRLGQISDSIRENNEESTSEKEENENDFSDELEKIPESNTHKVNPNDMNDDNEITFKNSIRNKYKKKQMDNVQDEVKLRGSKPNRENEKYNNSKKGHEFSNRKNNDGSNIDKKFARRLSKIHLTSTNWNINQLGDMNIYPDAIEVEE